MTTSSAHIITVDGSPSSGKKLFCLELAITLLYNEQKTAILLPYDSPLRSIIQKRSSTNIDLPIPDIINREDFKNQTQNYDAIIIPGIAPIDELAPSSDTFITLLTPKTIKKFEKDLTYINKMWELKKKIASEHKKSLNWVILENNLKEKSTDTKSCELQNLSRMYGFRVAPPINKRNSYLSTLNGISSQDKITSLLKKNLTYEDICAKREITKLAEFIFNQ